jgi:PAS domain S-box-containing protein
VLQYTGRAGRAGRVASRFASLLVLASVCVWTVRLVVPEGSIIQAVFPVASFAPFMLEMLLLVGVLLLVTTASRQPALPFGQAVLLSAGATVLVVSRILTQSIETPRPMLVPLGLLVSTGFFTLALSRYRVFETLPVATVVGRDRVIESVSEAIVTLDRQQQVHDCNRRAEELLDVDRAEVRGQPLSAVQPAVPAARRLANVDEAVRVRVPDGPLVSVTATEVRDHADRLFGYSLVARDVTERHSRERRLTLLNQLLVDVAHDRMEMVAQQVSALAEGEPTDRQPASVGDRVWNATTELTALVARTREIEQALTDGTDPMATTSTDVPTTVRRIVDELDVETGELETRLSEDLPTTTVDETLVEVALRSLLEDAIRSTSDAIRVAVEQSDPGTITVQIDVRVPSQRSGARDPESIDELSAQVARLAVNCVGGQVTIDEAERRWSVRLRLPTDPDDVGVVDDETPHGGGVRT